MTSIDLMRQALPCTLSVASPRAILLYRILTHKLLQAYTTYNKIYCTEPAPLQHLISHLQVFIVVATMHIRFSIGHTIIDTLYAFMLIDTCVLLKYKCHDICCRTGPQVKARKVGVLTLGISLTKMLYPMALPSYPYYSTFF